MGSITMGYGKDGAVKGILAAFWSTAALAEWLHDFRRVPSKARGDLYLAERSGWTRARTPARSILKVLAKAVADQKFLQ